MTKNIIIGAGPAGIGAGLVLEKDSVVLEKTSRLGGFSGSIKIKDAVFDFGGHSFHTPHPEVHDLVYGSLDMYDQIRKAKCFVADQIIPYPFQKNFRQLSNNYIVQECSEGLSQRNGGKNRQDFKDFEEFIHGTFGNGIAKHFMIPYNKKLWGRDLRRLAADWTNERVAAPEGIKEEFRKTGGRRKPLQSDTTVGYPAKGGFGEIYNAIGKKLGRVDFSTQVAKIDPKRKKVYTKEKRFYNYHKLINTIPIIDFLPMIEGVPVRLLKHADNLDYLSMILGLVVINHPVDTDIQRIYASDQTIASHKTAINHNSSDYLRSLPQHGIMLEISEGPDKKLYRQDMEQWIVDSLLKLRVIKTRDEVEEVQVRKVKYSYPVPTHERNQIMKGIKDWLEENDIFTVGRFGEWAYINSDKAIYRGMELGRKLLGD